MDTINKLSKIKDFLEKLKNNQLQSTGAKKITYTGDLYNVDGSTNDPSKIPGHVGESWVQLLTNYGIDTSNCYVTAPLPPSGKGKSHPSGSIVGGHMTQNADGSVSNKTCYLMPLCKWHNSKKRDHIAFKHTKSDVLELTGYMLGELHVTFMLRLPSEYPYAMLYYLNGEWSYRNISEEEAKNELSSVLKSISSEQEIKYYALIEKNWQNEKVKFGLISTNLI